MYVIKQDRMPVYIMVSLATDEGHKILCYENSSNINYIIRILKKNISFYHHKNTLFNNIDYENKSICFRNFFIENIDRSDHQNIYYHVEIFDKEKCEKNKIMYQVSCRISERLNYYQTLKNFKECDVLVMLVKSDDSIDKIADEKIDERRLLKEYWFDKLYFRSRIDNKIEESDRLAIAVGNKQI